jgi:hypothetical protein
VSCLGDLVGDLAELKEVLAELFMADGHRERALGIYTELQHPGLFDFIHLHKLYAAAHDKVGMYSTVVYCTHTRTTTGGTPGDAGLRP